jgi:hypothetical protein
MGYETSTPVHKVFSRSLVNRFPGNCANLSCQEPLTVNAWCIPRQQFCNEFCAAETRGTGAAMKPRRAYVESTADTAVPLLRPLTSAHLRERARLYRYAAALSDDPQDAKQFGELAFMLERTALILCDRRTP